MSLISITRKEGLQFEVRVRSHAVTSDMAPEDGGEDKGLSPSELLVGSLGACVAMLAQRYCDRHGYCDGEVAASLTYELADDPKRIAAITIDLEVPKDLPEDRYAAIKRIAEACPIHGTLTHPPEIDLEVMSV